MGERRNPYKILIGKLEEKKVLERIRGKTWKYGLHSADSVVRCCEQGNGTLGLIKVRPIPRR
jgi:hypothetical protein